MQLIRIIATKNITGDIERVFQFVVPIDLKTIIKKKGVIPGVTSTSNCEKWYIPGMTRTVFFDDNSTAEEKLLDVTEFTSFSYEIKKFSSLFKYLITKIEGKWSFTTNGTMTNIVWEYVLFPHNVICYLIITVIIKSNIKKVLYNSLDIIKNQFENTMKSDTWYQCNKE